MDPDGLKLIMNDLDRNKIINTVINIRNHIIIH